jgi:hypothetical protein
MCVCVCVYVCWREGGGGKATQYHHSQCMCTSQGPIRTRGSLHAETPCNNFLLNPTTHPPPPTRSICPLTFPYKHAVHCQEEQHKEPFPKRKQHLECQRRCLKPTPAHHTPATHTRWLWLTRHLVMCSERNGGSVRESVCVCVREREGVYVCVCGGGGGG